MRARLRGGERRERDFAGASDASEASGVSGASERASRRREGVVGSDSLGATLRARASLWEGASERGVFGRERTASRDQFGVTGGRTAHHHDPRLRVSLALPPPLLSQAEAPSVFFVTTPLFLPSINRASPPPDPLSSPPRAPSHDTLRSTDAARAPLCLFSLLPVPAAPPPSPARPRARRLRRLPGRRRGEAVRFLRRRAGDHGSLLAPTGGDAALVTTARRRMYIFV